MHDVADWLVPATDEPVPRGAARLSFLRHMAALHAAYWGCGSEYEVVPAMHRYLELSPWLAEAEAACGPSTWCRSWSARAGSCCRRWRPAAAAIVSPLALDPGPLVTALATDAADVRAQQLEAGQPRHR